MYGISSSFAKFDVLFFAGILFCNKSEFLNCASHNERELDMFLVMKIAKYIYSSTALMYSFEVLLLQCFIFMVLILLLHCI